MSELLTVLASLAIGLVIVVAALWLVEVAGESRRYW